MHISLLLSLSMTSHVVIFHEAIHTGIEPVLSGRQPLVQDHYTNEPKAGVKGIEPFPRVLETRWLP